LGSYDKPIEPEQTKQRSNNWRALRNGAKFKGSTLFKALGLSTLKEQQAYFNKVFKGKIEPVPPELQVLFDYGSSNEINALATTLRRVLPFQRDLAITKHIMIAWKNY
jgi:hypothetical protein